MSIGDIEFDLEDLSDVEPTDDPYIYARKRLASTEKVKIDVRRVKTVEHAANSSESCFVKYRDGGYDTCHVDAYEIRKRVKHRKKQLAASRKNDLDNYIDKRVDKRLKEALNR